MLPAACLVASERAKLAGGDVMNAKQWSTCTEPAAMLRDRGLLTERKARFFGAACCRRLWNLLPDEGRRAVEVVERHANGLVGREELDAVREAFTAGMGDASGPASFADVAVSYLLAEARHDPAGYALDLSPWAAQAGVSHSEELAAQARIIRCLFGSPPFRQARLDPGSLASDMAALAQAAYDCRGSEGTLDLDRLAVLADSLEEAGADADLLAHLHLPGTHHRGCFAVDLARGTG